MTKPRDTNRGTNELFTEWWEHFYPSEKLTHILSISAGRCFYGVTIHFPEVTREKKILGNVMYHFVVDMKEETGYERNHFLPASFISALRQATLLYPPTHTGSVQPYLFAVSVQSIVFRRLSWQISREAVHPLLRGSLKSLSSLDVMDTFHIRQRHVM